MKWILTLTMSLCSSLTLLAQNLGNHPSVQKDSTTTRGTAPMGPPTLDHPSYPSSGPLRSLDVENKRNRGGVTLQETENPKAIENNYDIGPYQDGNYTMEAQEAESETD